MKKIVSLTLLILTTQTIYSADNRFPLYWVTGTEVSPLLWPTGDEVTGDKMISPNIQDNEHSQTLKKTPKEITARIFVGKNKIYQLFQQSQLQQENHSMCSVQVKQEEKEIAIINYWIDANGFFCINPWKTQFFSRVQLQAEESLPSDPSEHTITIDNWLPHNNHSS